MEPFREVQKKKKSRRKLFQALEASAALTGELQAVTEQMSDRQKKIFESILAGDDDLTAALKSGANNFFTGVARIVYTESGRKMDTEDVTLENKDFLDKDSYERLNRLCASQIRKAFATDDYRKYTNPIKEYIKRYAPIALNTIVDLTKNAKKEDVRLRAAQDLLNRGGEGATPPERDVIVPVQLNIMLTGEKGNIIKYGNENGNLRSRSK